MPTGIRSRATRALAKYQPTAENALSPITELPRSTADEGRDHGSCGGCCSSAWAACPADTSLPVLNSRMLSNLDAPWISAVALAARGPKPLAWVPRVKAALDCPVMSHTSPNSTGAPRVPGVNAAALGKVGG
jgi:hypothetical protein